MRFNPPPNWPPAPPGWTPPPGWQPDPAWGPPPAGWPLWLDDHGQIQDAPVLDFPVDGPGHVPPRRRTGLIVAGACVAVILLIAAAVIAVVATRDTSGPIAGPTTSTTAAPDSDEDALRAVVEEFERTWNARDYDGWSALLCASMQGDPDFDEEAFDEVRETSGRLALTVNTFEIDGDDATLNISQEGEDPDDIAFVREEGDWKWCEL